MLIAERAAGGMRDAESMLDQVISGGDKAIDADDVRELLGLAEIEQVDAFIDALVGGEPLAGVRLLDVLEREGRDLFAFADQAVLRLRQRLVAVLDSTEGARVAASYARAARRLAGLDVNRALVGGYRLQLELALLDAGVPPSGPSTASSLAAAQDTVAASPNPKPVTPPARDGAPAAAATTPPPAELAPTIAADRPAPATSPATTPLPVDEPPPAGPAAETFSALDSLQAAWPRVVETVGRNPANRPLIMACRPLEVRDSTVVLGFPESQAFLRDIAERKRAVLEEVLSSVIGRPVAVRCVATNIEAGPALESAVTNSELVAHARKVFEDDLRDVADVD